MIKTQVRVKADRDAAGAVDEGVRNALFDAADAGFRQSLQDVPHGATSGLAESAFEPQEADDGSIIWGYTAEYAPYVRHGTRPHWPPIEPLKTWARRVLGDESAAWAVQRKIAQEGTPAQDFIGPAIETMKAKLRTSGISGYIDEAMRE